MVVLFDRGQLSVTGQWSNVFLEDFGKGGLGTSYAPPTISYFEYFSAPVKGVKDFATIGSELVRDRVAT